MFKKIIKLIKNIYSNYFEIASFVGATSIILIAILLDNVLNLRACPLCILTRYIFGVIAIISLIDLLVKRLDIVNKLLIAAAAVYGIIISQKLIYLQNLSPEEKKISDKNNPPNFRVEFFNEQKNINMINCYSNEGDRWEKSNISIVNNILTIKFREPFKPRRGRINCSLNDEGKWRWLGTQFIIKLD